MRPSCCLSMRKVCFTLARMWALAFSQRELWIRAHSGLGKIPVVLTLLGLSSSLECTTKPSNLPLWGRRWFFWHPREDYLSPEGVSRLRCSLLTQASLSIIGVLAELLEGTSKSDLSPKHPRVERKISLHEMTVKPCHRKAASCGITPNPCHIL